MYSSKLLAPQLTISTGLRAVRDSTQHCNCVCADRSGTYTEWLCYKNGLVTFWHKSALQLSFIIGVNGSTDYPSLTLEPKQQRQSYSFHNLLAFTPVCQL